MIEYVDAQKCDMTFCLNAAPIYSRVRFFHLHEGVGFNTYWGLKHFWFKLFVVYSTYSTSFQSKDIDHLFQNI